MPSAQRQAKIHTNQRQAAAQPPVVVTHLAAPTQLQARLTIGPVDDPYEREAERVAEQVMRMPAPGIQRAPAQIQRCSKCAGKPVEELCPSCKAKTRAERRLLQRAADGATPEVTPDVEGDIQALRGGGQPLDGEVRRFMEPRFGYDFGNVRVHTGPQAARAASSVQALAFTLGSDVVFGAGQYQPGSESGQHLIAHELTHVVQQGAMHSPTTLYSYRPKKGSRYYGREDTATLHEESFSKKQDRQKKPWIQLIDIVFDDVAYDSYGAMPKGTLSVHYYENDAALADFSLAILGGSAEHGFTTGGEHTVHRIEGVGYNQQGRYAPIEADGSISASMHFAVFFHRGEAIHAGSLTEGSHGCVHVDWGSNPDWKKLRRINYHSVIGLTKVHVTYASSTIENICCARSAHLGVKKRGRMKNPCDKADPSACSTISGSVAPRAIQPRLTIGPVDDPYEREAERVAEQVMRLPAPSIQRAPAQIQRCSKCAGKPIEDMCPSCAAKARTEQGLLQRAADGATPEVTPDIEGEIQSLHGGGQPLDASVRSFMEPHFGYDFGSVRVHTGPQADRAASSVNALAFTLGNDVVFSTGQYQPGSAAGNRLIAHELTHVVQQGRSIPKIQRHSAGATAQAAMALDADRVAFVREEGLNLREGPNQSSKSLALLAFGQKVHVLENPNAQSSWLKVSVLGQVGYVFAPRVHFAPKKLLQKDPGLSLIRVKSGETFWSLVKRIYGIQGNESTKDQNINHFINAIRAFNKAEAFKVKTDFWDDVGNAVIPGRDASDTYLIAGVDLWIPSFGVAAKMDVGSGTVSGEITRFIKKIEQKIEDFKTAFRLAGKYIPEAVLKNAGAVGSGLLEGLLTFAKEAAVILAASTAVGALIGAFFGGVGAIPGAEIGFEIGLLILEYYGLYMLIEAVLSMGGSLLSKLGDFVSLAWTANGDKKQLEQAGQSLADALGLLVSAVLVALVAYITHKGMKALSKTKFAKTVGETRLAKWLAERQKGTTTKRTIDEYKEKRSKANSESEAKAKASLEERRRALGTDPKRGYIEHEGEVGALIENRYGGFERDLSGDAEWISQSGPYKGKSFDLVGIPKGKSGFHSDNLERFLPSVDAHFRKQIDYVVLDTRYMTTPQKATVLKYIDTKWAAQKPRLITLE